MGKNLREHHIIGKSVLLLLKSELAEINISVIVMRMQGYFYSELSDGESSCEKQAL